MSLIIFWACSFCDFRVPKRTSSHACVSKYSYGFEGFTACVYDIFRVRQHRDLQLGRSGLNILNVDWGIRGARDDGDLFSSKNEVVKAGCRGASLVNLNLQGVKRTGCRWVRRTSASQIVRLAACFSTVPYVEVYGGKIGCSCPERHRRNAWR